MVSHIVSSIDFAIIVFGVTDTFLLFCLIGGLMIKSQNNTTAVSDTKITVRTDTDRKFIVTKDAVARFFTHGQWAAILGVLNMQYGESEFPMVMATIPIITYATYGIYRAITHSKHKMLSRSLASILYLVCAQFFFMLNRPGWLTFHARFIVFAVVICFALGFDLIQQMDYGTENPSTVYNLKDVYMYTQPLEVWVSYVCGVIFFLGVGIGKTVRMKHTEYFSLVFVILFFLIFLSFLLNTIHKGRKEAEYEKSAVIRHTWNVIFSLMGLLTTVMVFVELSGLIPEADRNPSLSIGLPLILSMGFLILGVSYTSLNYEDAMILDERFIKHS